MGETVYQETRIGNYRHEFTMPDDVETDNIKAEMKDGVLIIKINKPETSQPKRIEITNV